MAKTDTAFLGSVPELYTRYLGPGLDTAVAAATRAIAERFGRGPIEASMQAHIITATRPLSK